MAGLNLFTLFNPFIRFLPQGTVDIQLGPDRLAGPNQYIPINRLIERPFSGSPNCTSVHGTELFDSYAFPQTHTVVHLIQHVRTTFNVFTYDAVWAEHPTHHLPDTVQMHYVLCQGRGFRLTLHCSIKSCCPFLQILHEDFYNSQV